MNRHLLYALLLLIGTSVDAAEPWTTFEGPGYRVTLPGKWSSTATAGMVRYQAESGRPEALTVGVYAPDRSPADEAHQREFMMSSAERRRRLERQLGTSGIVLSPISQARAGAVLKLVYSGREAETNRRFVNVMLSSPSYTRNFYYEAIGLQANKFEERTRCIFTRLEVREPELRPRGGNEQVWSAVPGYSWAIQPGLSAARLGLQLPILRGGIGVLP